MPADRARASDIAPHPLISLRRTDSREFSAQKQPVRPGCDNLAAPESWRQAAGRSAGVTVYCDGSRCK